jgi:hypothetical protein
MPVEPQDSLPRLADAAKEVPLPEV